MTSGRYQIRLLLGGGRGWMDHAACGELAALDVFFGDPETAKAICAGCPVTAECRAYADANHIRLGVWGGDDLGAPRRERVAECGTPEGYRRHRSEGTTVCPECRDAWNAHKRAQRRAKRERVAS